MDRTNIVPRESCFEGEEYELMAQCCKFQPGRRLKLLHVKKRISEIREDAGR